MNVDANAHAENGCGTHSLHVRLRHHNVKVDANVEVDANADVTCKQSLNPKFQFFFFFFERGGPKHGRNANDQFISLA